MLLRKRTLEKARTFFHQSFCELMPPLLFLISFQRNLITCFSVLFQRHQSISLLNVEVWLQHVDSPFPLYGLFSLGVISHLSLSIIFPIASLKLHCAFLVKRKPSVHSRIITLTFFAYPDSFWSNLEIFLLVQRNVQLYLLVFLFSMVEILV